MNNDRLPALKLRKWLMRNKESTLPGLTITNEMFKLALANASRHVLLRSKVLSILHFLSMNNAMG